MQTIFNEIPELAPKGLRQFGLLTGTIVVSLFGLFVPWIWGTPGPVWPWLVGGTLAVWGIIAPTTLRIVYRLWMCFGLLLNRITTPVFIGLVFFVVITPLGLVMRILGRDPIAKAFDGTSKSYRVVSRRLPKTNMEGPF